MGRFFEIFFGRNLARFKTVKFTNAFTECRFFDARFFRNNFKATPVFTARLPRIQR
jgi:hypothetical protein